MTKEEREEIKRAKKEWKNKKFPNKKVEGVDFEVIDTDSFISNVSITQLKYMELNNTDSILKHGIR